MKQNHHYQSNFHQSRYLNRQIHQQSHHLKIQNHQCHYNLYQQNHFHYYNSLLYQLIQMFYPLQNQRHH